MRRIKTAEDESEKVFVGGDGDFGLIGQNKNGSYVFSSLAHLLPEKEKELGRFWTIIALKGHVYFCSNEKILDYDYKTIKIIHAGEEGFHTFFKVENTFVVREKGKGLKFLGITGELAFFKGGEQFADNSNPIRGIIKSKQAGKWLIITPAKVYEFMFHKQIPDLSEIRETTIPIQKWLLEKTVYCAANISSSGYAFGSVNGGLLITDDEFRPVKYINSGNDLQDDGVNYIYTDVQGHIWLALAKGISFIEFNSPVTQFTKSDGIKGTIEGCIFYKNTAYLATDKGLLKYNSFTLKFEETNLHETSWCLAEANGRLLAGTSYGLYLLENDEFKLIFETPSALHCIFVHPDGMIYLGSETGYARGTIRGKEFATAKEQFDLNADIRTITSDDEGAVYFSTTESGIFIEPPGDSPLVQLNEKDGFSVKETYLFKYNNKVYAATETGIIGFDKINGKYSVRKDPAFADINSKYFIIKGVSIKDEIWVTSKPRDNIRANESFLCLEKSNGIFHTKPMLLSRIKESNVKSFCFNDSLVYIGTNNGLYCYDITMKKPGYFLNTFVNYFNCGKDTSMYFNNISPRTEVGKIVLDYKNNAIEVKLGASDYLDKNELLFSYYLKGRDQGYGPFSNNKIIKFDHLMEGDYEFHVKSKNILGIEGQEIRIAFSVLPPWYRTIWAYLLYTLAFLVLVYFLIKLNVRRLREQNIRLENIITDRTKEINKQKLEIEHKNQEITDSINYAKGIQDSILPGVSEIKKVWNDLFIFFQPKDIVSGDFYWFKQISNDEFLIAAADCTGHGVPGGFMSMVCSDKLHDAARTHTDPDQILFHANNSIKETLRQQNEGKSKDGMEICLLKINTKTREVKYAGANRPLWILDSTTKELSEIKPTKASIASFTEFNFKYELHAFQLKAGDILYSTSDGYVDQFGGAQGKKYMSKNLKNFLIGNSHLSMQEQGELLKKDINDWMSRYEQVDDLLVIGVRL
ncbi:MAG: Response regulator containing a CheY-like receiver domain and a domain protein [Bacteroidetes bacterium]|nr:Response regulator containing a CheY-like receiver domain and a domain protein [Bacteroidota bacterium]